MIKNNNIMSLSHNDLDMLGCQLVLEYKFKDNIEYWNTNYRNIDEKVYQMEQYFDKNDVKLIVISDVSMANNLTELLKLSELGVPVLFFDHHHYPDGFFDNLPSNITYIHDENRCGAKITAEYFKLSKDIPAENNLINLIEYINAYDLWKTKEDKFEAGYLISDYCWEVGFDVAQESIAKNNFKLPSNFKSVSNSLVERTAKNIQTLKNKNLYYNNGKITIVFTNDGFDRIVLDDMKKGAEAVLIGTSYGQIKIRLNQYGKLTDNDKTLIRERIGSDKIGHLNAFPFICEKRGFENLMNDIKNISSIINEYIINYAEGV